MRIRNEECPVDFKDRAIVSKSINELVKQYNKSPTVISRWLNEVGITISKSNKTLEEIYGLDFVASVIKSTDDIDYICNILNCDRRRVIVTCSRLGIVKDFENIGRNLIKSPGKNALINDFSNGMTKTQILKKYNVNGVVLSRWLKEENIDVPSGRKLLEIPTKEELERLHFENKYTLTKIGEIYNRDISFVIQWFRMYNINKLYIRPKRVLIQYTEDELKNIIAKNHHNDKMPLNKIAEYLNVSDVHIGNLCEKYNIEVRYYDNGTSENEKKLLSFIQSYYSNATKSRLALDNKQEIDCYIDELKFGIEYNGLYWHSDEFLPQSYHLDKLNTAKSNNIKLIQIFEDEWIEKHEIVKSILLSKIGKSPITQFARTLDIVELDYTTTKNFLTLSHLQGCPKSIKHSFGLVNKKTNEIFGVMTFGNHHRGNKHTDEIVLNRLAFALNTNIVGGASKLFKYATKKLKYIGYKLIKSWSDKRWSQGDIYVKLGFKHTSTLKPDYSYIKNQKRYSKQSFQKKKIGCPENMTEYQYVKTLGYNRIWDCGKDVWVYELN